MWCVCVCVFVCGLAFDAICYLGVQHAIACLFLPRILKHFGGMATVFQSITLPFKCWSSRSFIVSPSLSPARLALDRIVP